MRDASAKRWGAIELRMAMLVEQGRRRTSTATCKGGYYTRGMLPRGVLPGGLDGDGNAIGHVTNINILVPRPDMPLGGRSARSRPCSRSVYFRPGHSANRNREESPSTRATPRPGFDPQSRARPARGCRSEPVQPSLFLQPRPR
jgi:hypothetical protein